MCASVLQSTEHNAQYMFVHWYQSQVKGLIYLQCIKAARYFQNHWVPLYQV